MIDIGIVNAVVDNDLLDGRRIWKLNRDPRIGLH